LNFGLGTFFLVLPIVLIWHCWTSTCWRSTFKVYASKLMKTSKRRSSDGDVCRLHNFTTKAWTLWSAAVIHASTDTVTVSKNRLLMYLYITDVLL
jgi:hypothetical protein